MAQPHLHAVLPEVWNAGERKDTRVSGILVPTASPFLALAPAPGGDLQPAWLNLS